MPGGLLQILGSCEVKMERRIAERISKAPVLCWTLYFNQSWKASGPEPNDRWFSSEMFSNGTEDAVYLCGLSSFTPIETSSFSLTESQVLFSHQMDELNLEVWSCPLRCHLNPQIRPTGIGTRQLFGSSLLHPPLSPPSFTTRCSLLLSFPPFPFLFLGGGGVVKIMPLLVILKSSMQTSFF